jgi:hypothetical protein
MRAPRGSRKRHLRVFLDGSRARHPFSGTHLRGATGRRGRHTVAEEMQEVRLKGRHRLKVKNNKGEWEEAVLDLRYRRIRVPPSRAKKKQCPELTLTVLYARGTRHAQRPGENRLEIGD